MNKKIGSFKHIVMTFVFAMAIIITGIFVAPETASAACKHTGNKGTGTVTQYPTCTKAGYRYKRCTKCNNNYGSPYQYTGSLGHTGNSGNGTVTQTPNCTRAGYRYKRCTRSGCGANYGSPYQYTGPLGHSLTKYNCTSPIHCTRSGCNYSQGVATGHSWKAATCTTAKTCTKCGEKSGTAPGHKFSAATCTSPQRCMRSGCTAVGSPAKGHKWIEETCTAPRHCANCGASTGTASGHSWKAATCVTPKTCTKCGEKSGTAPGHKWSAVSCTSPQRCMRSGCTATGKPATGHKWIAETCTAPRHCANCGVSTGTASGHSWKAATCTTPKTCTKCGEKSGAALNHQIVSATCTKAAYCSRPGCNTTFGNPAPHNYEWTILKKPTYTTDGLKQPKCKDCGYVGPQVVIDHNHPFYETDTAYNKSIYHQRLQNVTLTGDKHEDLLRVAESQINYHEGNSLDDLDGMNTKGSYNYTEYCNWLKKENPSLGLTGHDPWCASFIVWCAYNARIDSLTVKSEDSALAAGLAHNIAHSNGKGYMPKKGDIVHYKHSDGSNHVGIVESVDKQNKTMTTIEGNIMPLEKSDYVPGRENEGIVVRRKENVSINKADICCFASWE